METKGIYTSPKIRRHAQRRKRQLIAQVMLVLLYEGDPELVYQVAGFVEGLQKARTTAPRTLHV